MAANAASSQADRGPARAAARRARPAAAWGLALLLALAAQLAALWLVAH
jgi:hypothetical protein